jgi:hypothetical protein
MSSHHWYPLCFVFNGAHEVGVSGRGLYHSRLDIKPTMDWASGARGVEITYASSVSLMA